MERRKRGSSAAGRKGGKQGLRGGKERKRPQREQMDGREEDQVTL